MEHAITMLILQEKPSIKEQNFMSIMKFVNIYNN